MPRLGSSSNLKTSAHGFQAGEICVRKEGRRVVSLRRRTSDNQHRDTTAWRGGPQFAASDKPRRALSVSLGGPANSMSTRGRSGSSRICPASSEPIASDSVSRAWSGASRGRNLAERDGVGSASAAYREAKFGLNRHYLTG